MAILNPTGNYLKADDARSGALVTFKDAGVWVESRAFKYDDGNPKSDFVMKVEYDGNDYLLKINKFSRDELVPAYGNDTEKWIGKQAVISIENYRSIGKKGIILAPVTDLDQLPKEAHELTPEQQAKVDAGEAWDE